MWSWLCGVGCPKVPYFLARVTQFRFLCGDSNHVREGLRSGGTGQKSWPTVTAALLNFPSVLTKIFRTPTASVFIDGDLAG